MDKGASHPPRVVSFPRRQESSGISGMDGETGHCRLPSFDAVTCWSAGVDVERRDPAES